MPLESDFLERQNVDERLVAHGVDVLGDQIDLNTGALSFEHVDVSIPGNSSLPVEIRRSIRQSTPYDEKLGFGLWELEIPNISIILEAGGVYDGNSGPQQFDQTELQHNICDLFEVEPIATVSVPLGPGQTVGINPPGGPQFFNIYRGYQYSNGWNLSIPGVGEQKIMAQPTGVNWPAGTEGVTKDYWHVSCSSLGNGKYAAIATSPSGTQYEFSRVRAFDVSNIPFTGANGQGAALERARYMFLVTRITDVNGNTVDYTYNGSNKLTRIKSNDGRQIDLSYGTNGLISSVSAHGRTWTYSYSTISAHGQTYVSLTNVTRPDGQRWTFTDFENLALDGSSTVCGSSSPRTTSMSVTHPDGMSGTFNLRETRHQSGRREGFAICGLSQTPKQEANNEANWNSVFSVVSKTLSGSGYPSATWSYTYSGGTDDGTLMIPAADPNGYKWGEVTDPVGTRQRNYYVPSFSRTEPYLDDTPFT
ncbi:MAG: hypothetical protein AAGJ29_03095, partial [Pseudomonadota bacterium]